MQYLLEFYNGKPVTTFTAEPGARGRIAYTEDLAETNFEQTQKPLGAVLEKLLEYEQDSAAPTIYVGSRALDLYLPGLSKEDLKLALVKANRRFYIRFGYLVRQLSRVRSFYELKSNLIGAAELLQKNLKSLVSKA